MTIECAFFGTLARDAEHKMSQKGKPYLRFSVRVGDGDDPDWVSVMSFDDQALEVRDKMVKGARVYVEGKISINEWTGQDGNKRHGLQAMSWHTRLSEIGQNKPKRSDTAQHGTHAPLRDDLDDPLPF
jgi:single-strand DNA-binding protein